MQSEFGLPHVHKLIGWTDIPHGRHLHLETAVKRDRGLPMYVLCLCLCVHAHIHTYVYNLFVLSSNPH